MLVTTDKISIAANATDQNVLNTLGKRIKTVPENIAVGRLTVLATGSAAGLYMSVYAGSNNPVESSDVSAQNRKPLVPDDLVATDILVRGGEQLQITVQNTTAGALTFFFTVEIEDVSAQFGA